MDASQKYRKKPIEVDAILWTGANTAAVFAFTVDAAGIPGVEIDHDGTAELWIDANDAWVPIQTGSWIIRDASGCYPCLPERFAETYDAVTSGGDSW